MRKFKLLLFSLLFSTMAFGQMQDLQNLANGKLEFSSTLYDSNDKLYGYFYLYKKDVDKQNKTMEYVLLDKNLNKVASNTFTNNSYNNIYKSLYAGIKNEYLDCSLIGDSLILTNIYYYFPMSGNGFPTILSNTVQVISLKDNTISKELKYQDGVFSEITADPKLLKNENKKLATSYSIQAFDNGLIKGFIISDGNKFGIQGEGKDIRFYNDKLELIWKYEYNLNKTTTGDYTQSGILYSNKNNLYLLETVYKKRVVSGYKIVLLDMKTGQKKYDFVFEDQNRKYNHTIKVKEINGRLVIAGNYSPFKRDYSFRLKKNLGYYKLVLDENGKEVSRQYTQWPDFASQILIDKKGREKKKFSLATKRVFFFNDSTISILTEKYKPFKSGIWWVPIPIIYTILHQATHQHEQTSDLVLLNMNKDFQLQSVNTIKKDLTKDENNDYLFSQYIRNEEGGAFYYKDYTKNPETGKKQWMLGISTIVKGEVTEEKIPMFSKKKYFVDPFPAKEGYVMLREYNEKDKYNQVRLEKLNF